MAGQIAMADTLRSANAERAGPQVRLLLQQHAGLSQALMRAATGPAEPTASTRMQLRFLERVVRSQAGAAKLPECGLPRR